MASVTPAAQLFDLTGEVAFITGASSGLGVRFAEVLAAHGAKVVLAARRGERIEALAARLPRATAVTLDVTRREEIEGAFDAAEARLGPLTLLVNNAGISGAGRFINAPAEEWDAVQATNVSGPWHLSQAFARRLIGRNQEGAIINLASIAAYRVAATPAAYAVSKAAVEQMTKALAVELARHRIRVNAIAPGYIWSEMTEAYLNSAAGQAMLKKTPQRRAGDPSDLDGALLLLASRKASGFTTGSTITVDGGQMWGMG